MTKPLIFRVISFFIDFIAILSIITLLIILKANLLSYQISMWIVAGCALSNLILIAIAEYKLSDFRAKRFTTIMHISYATLAIGSLYLCKYLGDYDKLIWLYMLLPFLGGFIIILVFSILNIFLKEKKPEYDINKKL